MLGSRATLKSKLHEPLRICFQGAPLHIYGDGIKIREEFYSLTANGIKAFSNQCANLDDE